MLRATPPSCADAEDVVVIGGHSSSASIRPVREGPFDASTEEQCGSDETARHSPRTLLVRKRPTPKKTLVVPSTAQAIIAQARNNTTEHVPGLHKLDSTSDGGCALGVRDDSIIEDTLAPLTVALRSLSLADAKDNGDAKAVEFPKDERSNEAQTLESVDKDIAQPPLHVALAVQRLRWEAVCGPGALRLGVLRISNIAWDLSSADVLEAMSTLVAGDGRGRVPFGPEHVHIPIDRATGKTKADMYVEVLTPVDALRCVAHHAGRIVRGRALAMVPASAVELHTAHFGGSSGALPAFVDEDDAQRLVAICRNYKANFSRKCAERPFEHAASLLRLAAWERLDAAGRERVYRVAHGAVDALVEHLRMGSSQRLDMPAAGRSAADAHGHDLLARLQRAVRLCAALSTEQIAAIDAIAASYREEQRALLYVCTMRSQTLPKDS